MGTRGGTALALPPASWTSLPLLLAALLLLAPFCAHAQPGPPPVACVTPACKACVATLKRKGRDPGPCAACQDPRSYFSSVPPHPSLSKACYECVAATPGDPNACLTCGGLGSTNATAIAACMRCLKTKGVGAQTSPQIPVNACHCQSWGPPLDRACAACIASPNTATRPFDCVACAQSATALRSSAAHAEKCFFCASLPLRPADGDPQGAGRHACAECLNTFTTQNCLGPDNKLVDGCFACLASFGTELASSCFDCLGGRFTGGAALPDNVLTCLTCVANPATTGAFESACSTCVRVQSAAEYGTCTACTQALGPGSASRCQACFATSYGGCSAKPLTPDAASCTACIQRTNKLAQQGPKGLSGDLYQLWCAQCSLGTTKDARAACTDCLTSVGSDAAAYCAECASAKDPKACLQCVRKAAALPAASARNVSKRCLRRCFVGSSVRGCWVMRIAHVIFSITCQPEPQLHHTHTQGALTRCVPP